MGIRTSLAATVVFVLFCFGVTSTVAQTVTWRWGGLGRGSITNGSDGNLYIGSYAAGLLRTGDNGNTWSNISGSTSNPSLLNRDLRQIAVKTGGTIFIGGGRLGTITGAILRSTNNGISWDSVHNLRMRTIKVAPNGNVWAAGFLAPIYLSTDNGVSWQPKSSGLTIDDYFDLEILSPDTIFVAAFDGIYRTTNGGVLWTAVNTGLQAGGIASLARNSAGYIFAGAWDIGKLYRSTNRGGNWTEMTITPSPAHVVDIAFTTTGLGFAATDLGVYQSTDNGVNWQQLSPVISPVFANTGAVGVNSNGYLFATFSSGGVLRSASVVGPPVDPITSVGNRENGLPEFFGLSQNYPNPFNPSTTIEYEVPKRGDVAIRIYNSVGQLVKTLVSGEVKEAGRYSATWNGSDDRGNRVSSGVYFYTLQSGSFISTKKSILLK